nr:hypothetical protein [Tanacetum cinerariifolium]
YVPGPEEPELDYVPEPVYLEYLTPSDDDIPIKYQPLHVDALLTTLSPGYIADSDPEEDLEEDPEDDPGEAPANYLADGGDEEDGEESFRDEVDDEDDKEVFEEEEDDEEEKEHLALADSSIIPIDDHVPLAEETEPFEIDESAPTPSSPRLRRARISVQPQTPMVVATEALITTEDVLEANVLPRKRLCLIAPTPRFNIGESLAAAAKQPRFDVTHATDYGFVDTVDATPRHPMTREGHDRTKEPEPAKDLEHQDQNFIYVTKLSCIADALSEYEANRSSGNGDDSHDFESGRRKERATSSKAIEDIVSIGSFVEALVLNHYVLVRKILRMFPEVSDEVEKYVNGLPDMIQGSVMDQNIHTFVDRKAKNKRKLDDNSRNNQNQQ